MHFNVVYFNLNLNEAISLGDFQKKNKYETGLYLKLA